ncbi:uncharacterized protein nim1kb isoform X1 [Perca flavescens]|uniref:uncharacterized protein nim1kb isoform X1 n=1 Tax=Perca flavescens TaxID=8167 RepID=UPI00106E54EE|nr:uncharacterized protein LOC114571505 isoform X1 [Perca flavescens]XP_028458266.1 uncharacterized protein LOC114571505 isoform X1 [Perca flavescens]
MPGSQYKMTVTKRLYSLTDSSGAGLEDEEADGPPHLTPLQKLTADMCKDDTTIKDLMIGRRVGFYKVRGEIGSGTFSRVKLAFHALTKDKVALKILDKTRLDSQSQRLLSKEISSMECLQHPNVVCLYEVVETPRRLYLVLEYAGGGDLFNQIFTQGKLSDNASKVTFAQILSAIKYLKSPTGSCVFCCAARQQHHSPGPEGRERSDQLQRLREGGRLWIQHAALEPQRHPRHLLWLAALRRPRALQGRVLPGSPGGRVGHGGAAFLHGDRNYAVPRRDPGQAAALHPGVRLHRPPLGPRPLPEAHQGNLEGGPRRALRRRPDAGLRLAPPCGVSLVAGAARAGEPPAEPAGLGARGPGGGGPERAGGARLQRGAPVERPAQRKPQPRHRRLSNPAAPSPKEEGQRQSPRGPGDGEGPQEGGAPGLQGPQTHLQVLCAFMKEWWRRFSTVFIHFFFLYKLTFFYFTFFFFFYRKV